MSLQKQFFETGNSSASITGDMFFTDKSMSVEDMKQIGPIDSYTADTIEELLWDNRAIFKTIILTYGLSRLNSEIRTQLFFQIDWLLNSEEWEQGDKFPDIGSFKTLIKFILNANLVKAPALGLSDKGNLLASCISEYGKLILECMSNERVKYIAHSKINGKQKRAAGNAESIEDLLDLLAPFNNARWFYSNGEGN